MGSVSSCHPSRFLEVSSLLSKRSLSKIIPFSLKSQLNLRLSSLTSLRAEANVRGLYCATAVSYPSSASSQSRCRVAAPSFFLRTSPELQPHLRPRPWPQSNGGQVPSDSHTREESPLPQRRRFSYGHGTCRALVQECCAFNCSAWSTEDRPSPRLIQTLGRDARLKTASLSLTQ